MAPLFDHRDGHRAMELLTAVVNATEAVAHLAEAFGCAEPPGRAQAIQRLEAIRRYLDRAARTYAE